MKWFFPEEKKKQNSSVTKKVHDFWSLLVTLKECVAWPGGTHLWFPAMWEAEAKGLLQIQG